MPITTHVGLDVHRNSIFVAIRSQAERQARDLGQVPHDLTRLLRKLEPLGAPA